MGGPVIKRIIFTGEAMTATTVLLSGEARRRFGREFKLHLDTNTPAEAIRALCSILGGFRAYLMNARERGMEFAIWRGSGKQAENLAYDQLREPAGGLIRIVPVHAGAKNAGVLQTIVGVALAVVGSIYLPGSTGFAKGLFASMQATGIGMAAGGVVQLLSPQPKLQAKADKPENQASYLFNGAVNTTAQGGCVPVLYGGPMEIGSTVISARMDAVDYSSRPSNVGLGTATGNLKQTPYDAA